MFFSPVEGMAQEPAATSARLVSLDALRGFDMFWIVGGADILLALHKITESGPLGVVTRQLHHKDWEGFAFEDLIFPLFVFIVGVSIVLSLPKTLAKHGTAGAFKRILLRGLLLFVF